VIVGDGLELLISEFIRSRRMLPFDRLLKEIDVSIVDAIESKHQEVFRAFREFAESGRVKYVVGNHDSLCFSVRDSVTS
jgi:UDP-2,3-diacylglucosamine pyrophosphatase LpxH